MAAPRSCSAASGPPAHTTGGTRTRVHRQNRLRLRLIRGETNKTGRTVAVTRTSATTGAELVLATGAIKRIVRSWAHSTRIRGVRQNRRIRRQHTGTAAAAGNNHRHAIHLNSGRTTAGRRIQHSAHAAATGHTARNAGQSINRRNNIRGNRRRSLRGAAHTVAVAALSGLQLTITDTTRTGSQSNSLAAAHSHRTLHQGTGTGISHSVVRATGTAHSGKTHTLSARRNRQHGNLLYAVTGSDHRRILVRSGALAFLIRRRIRRNHR